MSVSYGSLIDCCTKLLDSFNSKSSDIEDYIESNFTHNFEHLEDVEKLFVKEVIVGCVRYGSVLDVVVDAYYRTDGEFVLKSNRNLFKELGMANFRKCVKSQDIGKMGKFFRFAFNEGHFISWMKDEWNKLYDVEFVQTTLLQPLLRWMPCLHQMLDEFSVTNSESMKPMKKTVTISKESKPSNATKQNLKRIAMPTQIPMIAKPVPVPMTTYKCPSDHQILEQTKIENKRKAKAAYESMQANSASYMESHKSNKTLQRMLDIVECENRKLDFDAPSTKKPAPVPVTESVAIRLNTTAILREELLYRKQEAQVMKKIERLEAGEKDTTDFDEWKARMKKIDMDKKLEDVEIRRLSGLMSQEEAIIAKHRLILQNKERVTDMKAEAQRMMNEYMCQQLVEQDQRKKMMEKIANAHENSKDAKRKIQTYKSRIVQAMNEEMREMMRQALEEAEIEMRQRMQLIQEIRAMLSRSAARQPKFIDLTETGGYGLLCEMSLAELRERSRLLRIAEEEAEEAKRSQILVEKNAKSQMLLDKLETISKHRTELTKAASIKAEQRKKLQLEKVNPPKPLMPSSALVDMQQLIAERRAERRCLEQLQVKTGRPPDARQRLLPNQERHYLPPSGQYRPS